MGCLAYLDESKRPIVKEVHRLASLEVRLMDSDQGSVVVQNRVDSSLVVEIKEKQYDYLVKLKEEIHKNKTTTFALGVNVGTVRYQGRLCVPNVDGLRERIMTKAHSSRNSIHLGSTKIYHDLKEIYW